MEEESVLNPGCEVDLYCLHFFFLPMLNKALTEFKHSWNNHKLRTCKNKTPRQMFIQSIIEMKADGHYHAELDQVRLKLKIPTKFEISRGLPMLS